MRVQIREDAVEVWALAAEPRTAYRFHLPRLYKSVLVDRSAWRWSAKYNRVKVTLAKGDNHAWPLLRG